MNSKMLHRLFKVSVIFCSFLVANLNLNAQNADPVNFRVNKVETKDAVRTFEISVTGGTPEFKVYVLNKPLGQNGEIVLEAEKLNERKFKVINISLSSFYICVEDQDKNIVCKRNDKLTK